MSEVVVGIVAFSNVTKTDVYLGQDTGKYTVTVTVDDETRSRLEDLGVRVKDYEGKGQRKFTTKFEFTVEDAEGLPFAGEIPYGSKVKILADIKGSHPQWGPSTFFKRIKVLEKADNQDDAPDDF